MPLTGFLRSSGFVTLKQLSTLKMARYGSGSLVRRLAPDNRIQRPALCTAANAVR
jgi:hypothetical protein